MCKHRQHADLGSEVFGIAGHLQQSLRGGPHQQAVDRPWVCQGERVQEIGEREDDMEILVRQEIGRPEPASHCSLAVAWHLGQWRLRQEL